MAEQELGLRAYLFGSYLIEAMQQIIKCAPVAKYGVDAKAAHTATRAVVGECGLTAHLALGSYELLDCDAVLRNLGERSPYQLQDRRHFAWGTLPFHAPQTGIGVGGLASIDAVGQSAPFSYLDE